MASAGWTKNRLMKHNPAHHSETGAMENHLQGIKPLLRNCKHEAQHKLSKQQSHDNLLLNSTYPLFNRVIHSFARAAGVGALTGISRQFVHCTFEGVHGANGRSLHDKATSSASKLHGQTNKQCLKNLVENTAKESLQWGLAAGMFTGVSIGLQEAQGEHKMGHTALAGALAGALTNLAMDEKPHLECTLQSAITGGALALAGEVIHRTF
ncbi:hypothetical protein GOP47_0006290 [Adiantum capillus-veneris]|uniref:Uncharacterized protein n=1 Tax=Adiantum capillus-veneris TaxID=13818 RepID=A0A9D4V300_ADICA|nr:hypothetical protein GOP47_0006290 [Adiantum capillus-veneris]